MCLRDRSAAPERGPKFRARRVNRETRKRHVFTAGLLLMRGRTLLLVGVIALATLALPAIANFVPMIEELSPVKIGNSDPSWTADQVGMGPNNNQGNGIVFACLYF